MSGPSIHLPAVPPPGGVMPTRAGEPEAPRDSAGKVPRTPLYAWYVLALLSLAQVINFMDRMLLNVLVDPIKAEFGVSDTQMGLLTGFVFVLLYACVGVPMARLADRWSRRNVLALGILVWSTMTLLSGFARSFVGLGLTRMGVAASESVSGPSSFGLIADYFPKERRSIAVAIFQSTLGIGVFAGFLVGGLMGERYGWRSAFWVAAVPGFILPLLLWWTLREPERGATEAPGVNRGDMSASFMQNLRWLLSRRAFMLITFATAFVSLQGYAYLIWSASFLRRVHGLDGAQAGTLLSLWLSLPTILGMLFGGFVGTWLHGRVRSPDRWVLRLCGLSMLVALPLQVAFLFSPHLEGGLVMLGVATFIGSFPSGPSLACGLSAVRASMRSQAASIWVVVISIVGQGGGALVVGMVSDHYAATMGAASVRYGLAAALVGNLLAFACYWASSGRYEQEQRTL